MYFLLQYILMLKWSPIILETYFLYKMFSPCNKRNLITMANSKLLLI